MILTFTPEKHEYKSVDTLIDWLSVTTFVSHFKQPFDSVKSSISSSKNKKSTWYGMNPESIRNIWDNEGFRATDMGTWYHDQREKDITDCDTIVRDGIELPVFKPLFKEGIKIAPEQKLVNGIYPEHFVYLVSAGLCGQSDRVEVINDHVNIGDYKTNKKLNFNGYTNWEGVTTMMTGPLSHLEDCHIVHYGIQLSLYMYMILKHNHNLKPGKLTIEHVIFESEGKDAHGYPLYKKDEQGNFIVKDVQVHELPYYKKEVQDMINYVKSNRHLIKTKK